MKVLKTTIALSLILIAFGSCTNKPERFHITDIEGRWHELGLDVYEEWKIVGGNHLSGKAYKVEGGKEQVYEVLEIKEINGSLTYLADRETEMGLGIVDYPMVSRTKNGMVFINKENDYPQVLFYEKFTEDSLKVTAGSYPLHEDKNPTIFNYVREEK